MDVRKLGYIRVSSKDQNEIRKLEAMKDKRIGMNGRARHKGKMLR